MRLLYDVKNSLCVAADDQTGRTYRDGLEITVITPAIRAMHWFIQDKHYSPALLQPAWQLQLKSETGYAQSDSKAHKKQLSETQTTIQSVYQSH